MWQETLHLSGRMRAPPHPQPRSGRHVWLIQITGTLCGTGDHERAAEVSQGAVSLRGRGAFSRTENRRGGGAGMRDWANLAHGGICKRKGTTEGPQRGNKSWIPPLLLSPEPALLGAQSQELSTHLWCERNVRAIKKHPHLSCRGPSPSRKT